MKTRRNNYLARLRWWCLSVCLAWLAFGTPVAWRAQAEGESPSPVLVSENNSTRALMASAGNYRGLLPKSPLQTIAPGEDARAILFVTNINFAPDEAANALRLYAEDAAGKTYRLSVENVQPVRRQPWIYAVFVRFYDDVAYNGQPEAAGDVLVRLTWRGLTSNRVRVNFGANGKEIKDDEGAAPTPAPLEQPQIATAAQPRLKRSGDTGLNRLGDAYGDRFRFMEQAAFGPSAALDLRIRQIGIQRWLNEQYAKPYPTFAYPDLPLKSTDQAIGCPATVTDGSTDYARNACNRDFYTMYQLQRWQFNEALYGDDQLRRRVSWALSQVWVVSGNDTQQARWELEYIKLLDKHAFGNYRDLMKDMTLNPAMGNYLDMVRSTRRSPNENYPREIMQLFSIGLDELNLDGTPKIVGGARVPTYDQEKVVQFTKVFTGWTLCNQAPPACPNNPGGGIPNYIDPMIVNVGVGTPTASNPGNHDISAKTLFNYPGAPNATIAACANCLSGAAAANVQSIKDYAADSLNKTLDNIYNHPNVAPFVSKLLIQHLVTSDPSPAFVQRVAAVFNNYRTAPNQMAYVVNAILLDPEARGSQKTAPDYGKLREPFQLATNLMRQFKVRAANTQTVGGSPVNPPAECQNRSDGNINGQTGAMAQSVWYPPTVFNYYSPEYVIPGTDQTGPEFAILDTGTAFRRINFVNTMVYGQLNFDVLSATNPYPNSPCGTALDLSEAIAWATADTTGNALVDGLNRKMMYGTMSAAFKQKLLTAVTAISATGTNAARDRARQAVYLVVTSSQYQVQK